jgi:hypothetical protein
LKLAFYLHRVPRLRVWAAPLYLEKLTLEFKIKFVVKKVKHAHYRPCRPRGV